MTAIRPTDRSEGGRDTGPAALISIGPVAGGARHARPRLISRTDDRRITFGGLAVAAVLLGLALLSLGLPATVRVGAWLPLHLALAGSAATAVASLLPFFTAALSVAPPAGRSPRILGIAGIAGGALLVSGGVATGAPTLAVSGGLAYLAGLAAVAVATFAPLGSALGPRRPLVTRAYGVALACVAAGVALATGFLAGAEPIVERWVHLKPAHAWLNVVGALSLVVAATLIHLAPTVAGARIRPRSTARVAVVGLALGAPTIAVGIGQELDLVAQAGATVSIAGGLALVAHAIVVQRDRGRWTTDPAWHRMSAWSLLLAPAWLVVALGIAGGRSLVSGADPLAWDVGLVGSALAFGWFGQVLVGAWTHLLPAIGPGDPTSHARQRAILGRVAAVRIASLNGGTALATIGVGFGDTSLATAGIAVAAISLAAALALFAVAARVGFVTMGSAPAN